MIKEKRRVSESGARLIMTYRSVADRVYGGIISKKCITGI